MSVEAITWALKQPIKHSSAKFVLVVLANCASAANNQAYPSVAYLCESTSQNRKTVIENLRRLIEAGYVEDTGDRRGTTSQIVVYRLRIEVQRDGDLLTERHYVYRVTNAGTGRYYIGVRTCLGEPAGDASYLGSGRWPQHCAFHGIALAKTVLSVFASRYQAEQAEASLIAQHIDDPLCMNRASGNDAENGTVSKDAENGTVQRVPKTDGNSPEKGAKESQKRDTEPSVTVRNQRAKALAPAALDFSSWPSVPSPQVLADWLDLRKRKRAPVTDTALRGMGAQLHRAAALGYDVDAALTECVLRGWQGLNADWLQPDTRNRSGATPAPSKTFAALQRFEGMKHGLADHRTADRPAEVALLGVGPDPRD